MKKLQLHADKKKKTTRVTWKMISDKETGYKKNKKLVI